MSAWRSGATPRASRRAWSRIRRAGLVVRARFNARAGHEAGDGRQGGQAVPARPGGRDRAAHERAFPGGREQHGPVLARRCSRRYRRPAGGRQAEGRGRRRSPTTTRCSRRWRDSSRPACRCPRKRRTSAARSRCRCKDAASATKVARRWRGWTTRAASALLRSQLDTAEFEWTVKKESRRQAEDASTSG